MGYQPRNNLMKDENGALLADSHNILNRWKNYFSQLLNVHNVSDFWQIKVHMAQPLVPGSSHLKVEIAVAKPKMYKSPGSDQIPAELIQTGDKILLSAIYYCTDYNNYHGISLLSTSYKILSNMLLLRLSPYIDEIIGDLQCGF
jgi:hypothetical protein